MLKTYFSYSLGCRVNQAEIASLDQFLQVSGWKKTDINPQFIIINTCTVTEKADREARQLVYHFKKKFPQAKIIVTGCAVTYWVKTGQISKMLPYIALFIENKDKKDLPKILTGKNFSQKKSFNSINFIADKYISSGRILIKIQDGCQRFCSYCIVPYLRGLPKSKKISQILKEINQYQFLNQSLTEVILTAINTEAFGLDTGENLVDLIKAIIKKTSIARISFGSINPWSLDQKFFSFYKKNLDKQRLVDFFHIPLQSGSDKILKLMKRGYHKKEFAEKIENLHQISPLAFIATDIIVGFLGETDRDFEETYRLIEKAPIYRLHVFRFSLRKKTAAEFLSQKIPEPTFLTKKIRSQALIKLSKKKFRFFQEKHLGKMFSALFIEKPVDGYQPALLNNQMPVLIKTQKNLIGEIRNVKIKEIKKNNLLGIIV